MLLNIHCTNVHIFNIMLLHLAQVSGECKTIKSFRSVILEKKKKKRKCYNLTLVLVYFIVMY